MVCKDYWPMTISRSQSLKSHECNSMVKPSIKSMSPKTHSQSISSIAKHWQHLPREIWPEQPVFTLNDLRYFASLAGKSVHHLPIATRLRDIKSLLEQQFQHRLHQVYHGRRMDSSITTHDIKQVIKKMTPRQIERNPDLADESDFEDESDESDRNDDSNLEDDSDRNDNCDLVPTSLSEAKFGEQYVALSERFMTTDSRIYLCCSFHYK
jgi:hypothetical protein